MKGWSVTKAKEVRLNTQTFYSSSGSTNFPLALVSQGPWTYTGHILAGGDRRDRRCRVFHVKYAVTSSPLTGVEEGTVLRVSLFK